MHYKLGIDTGGTYTDGVILSEDNRVLAKAKHLTTRDDLSIGIGQTIASLLDGFDGHIGLVSLSTTLATNAIVEGQGRRVALLLPGFTERHLSRAKLGEAMHSDPMVCLTGGHKASGLEQAPIDIVEAEGVIDKLSKEVDAFAVCGMFAVRNPSHELQLKEMIQTRTQLPVSCGHELSSSLDAPRRALTAAINARLIPLLQKLIHATRSILAKHKITAPLMVVKGDGSLISADFAESCPVETILSGPAASVIGAHFLSHEEGDVLVSDMGGTTTDIALLHDGRPVLTDDGANVGGWHTMVKAVKAYTYGLGGDSEIKFCRQTRGFAIGPRRITPVSLMAQQYPEILPVLQEQADNWFVATHAGCFAMRRGELPEGMKLSPKQRDLWERLGTTPKALNDLYSDQTMDRALDRLFNLDLITLSGFTPSDAAHVVGKQTLWHREAAKLCAFLQLRYSSDNLGKNWETEEAFCADIMAQVSRQAAHCMLDSIMHEQDLPRNQTVLAPYFDLALQAKSNPELSVRLSIHKPIIGIGAPAPLYYDDTAELLDTRFISPTHGEVANAIGAVVGLVRQRVEGSITAITEQQMRAHGPEGTKDFHDLELAAEWLAKELERTAREHADQAGAVEVSVTHERVDNIVKGQGKDVFFDSKMAATASGRPATE